MREWTQKQDDRRAVRWLWVSILLHLPLTPLGQLFGLAALVSRCSEPAPPVEELTGIPVELLEQAPSKPQITPETAPASPAEASERVAILPKKTKLQHRRKDIVDAGSGEDDAGANQPLASLDASAPEALQGDAGADAGAAVAQAPNAAQALSAATHGIADSNANVQLRINMSRVRKQPLGADLGRILKSVYQWRDFFSAGGIDPVKDIDQIWIFGPQLRDSSQIAAFLKHNVRDTRMKSAIDSLVRQSGGESEWLKGTKYPAARAYADRAPRTIVMYPAQVVAVVPPGVENKALELSGLKWPPAKGEELVSATVKTPWRALRGTGFPFPKTIRVATIEIFPEQDGGARIEGLLDDENEEVAQKDANRLKQDIDSLTWASNWLLSGSRFAEAVQAHVDGSKIKLVLTVTRSQAERLFALAEGALTPEGRRATREAIKAALSDAGARPIPPIKPSAGPVEPHLPVPPSATEPTLPNVPTPPGAPVAPEPASSVP